MKRATWLLLALLGGALSAELTEEAARDYVTPKEFSINNRVLLKVNGKAISLLDVVRKMDLLFYRQYPELATSPIARYQFYVSSWKPILSTVIDEQLILADAAEKKIEVTDGDIREEIEALFGPQVVRNIDSIGLSFAEARELIKTELIVRKMNGMMVRSKAVSDVSPQEIKRRYMNYITAHPPEDLWVYRILSIRSQDKEKGERVATKAHELLDAQTATLDQLPLLLGEEEGVQVSVSEPYERPEKELSLAYRAVLQTIAIGKCSPPTEQIAKDGSTVTRIFVLDDHHEKKPSSFREMEDKFYREIVDQAITKHNGLYINKLRNQYGVTDQYISDMIPESYEPFSFR